MATVEDYTGLITSYHRGKPKFAATVAISGQASVDQQAMLRSIVDAFDFDVSIGVQLDVDGQWIGRSRYLAIPLPNVWFSFDTDGLGFDQGVWKGPYDSTTGLTRLDDDTYRLLLRAKIAANHWDGTLPGAAAALAYVFDGTGTVVYIEDRQDMSMVVGMAYAVPSALILSIIADGYIPVKPAGVRVDHIVTSLDGAPIFGFDTPEISGSPLAGFDLGAWGVSIDYALDHDLSHLPTPVPPPEGALIFDDPDNTGLSLLGWI